MNNWDQYQSTPKLLPPTVFERTNNIETTNNNNSVAINNSSSTSISANNITASSSNNNNNNNESFFTGESQFVQLSNELEKLKNEIRKLHTENEALRHRNKDFVEQAQLYTEATGHRQISISALEEIIHKQTKEIQQLKSDLYIERESNADKFRDAELGWNRKLNDLENRLRDVENEKQLYEETTEKRIEQIQKQNEIINSDRNMQLKSVIDEKNVLIETHNKEIDVLRRKIDQFEVEKNDILNVKEAQIKSLSEENKKYLSELENLRTYVNDSMPTIETIKEMTKERVKFEEQILKIKAKNDALLKENSALQIRLKSINEILTIQETQLEGKQLTSGSSNNEKRLLNKWRNKVFELLVQLKSLEINYKQEKSLEEKTIQDYLDRLEEQSNKNKILENVIEDKKAEICVLSADNSLLTEQVSALKETNQNLEKKCQDDLQSSMELKNFVFSLVKQYQVIEDSFKSANRKLSHLDQRVEFAKNRLGVIKALYSHKGSELRRMNVLDMTTNLSSIHGSFNPHESNIQIPTSLESQSSAEHQTTQNKHKSLRDLEDENENVNLIKQELDKVVSERNLLADRLQTDMQQMEERILKMKEDYELALASLNKELRQLRELNEEKDEKLNEANQKLIDQEKFTQNLNNKLQELREQSDAFTEQIKADHEKELRQRELEFMEKLSKLEKSLNEARREQDKAVVLMRQMERDSNREKERLEDILKSSDNYHKDYINKLQLKINSLEKEKNILLNTIRQNQSHKSRLEKNFPEEQESIFSFSSKKLSSKIEAPKSYIESNDYSIQIKSKSDNEEMTSTWLNTNQEIEVEEEEVESQARRKSDADNLHEEQENEEVETSDLNKNSEILQQIRKIMGNLELSDAEEDEDYDIDKREETYDRLMYNKSSKNTEYTEDYENDDDDDDDDDKEESKGQEDYQFETEHAIDEMFQKRTNSFSN